jgi:hypothetical protein
MMIINPKVEVTSPMGEMTVTPVPIAPRLDTLNGKTICELSSRMYNVEISFPILREMLKALYPGLKVIPYTEMDQGLPGGTMMTYSGSIAEQEKKTDAAIALVREKGGDAVIVGNGG